MANPIKSIRMDDELYEEMLLYCSITKITMAEFIRDAVDEYIKNRIEDDNFKRRAREMFAKDVAVLNRLLEKGK